jgi:site-specific DNA recombinase
MSARTFRCAIYTRKSTEEGLEKEFNSLDAQRDACAAYVRSQVGEGWKVLPQHYDDGGFTGANIERPALQRLLADVDRGLVDIVVVYKIDRLTRSLADFAKIVERFDARSISFVSITQSFNTTTSMGRLTLNVLLSFAQFEREVTAERIRDKIAASRAKGMWMGGGIPLGYDAENRKLVINPADADTVRMIFRRFLDLESIAGLRDELNRKGITTKHRVSSKGKISGGGRWYIGPLRHVLRNRVYVGDATHKDKVYPGEHQSIISKELFDSVQRVLDNNSNTWTRKRGVEASGLLTGLIRDDRNNAMTPQWSLSGQGRRRQYYVSQALLQRRRDKAGSLPRVSATIIDAIVTACANALFELAGESSNPRDDLRRVLKRVTLSNQRTRIEFTVVDPTPSLLARAKAFAEKHPGARTEHVDGALVVDLPHSIRRYGQMKEVELWTKDDWSVATPRHDQRLVKALVRAHALLEKVLAGEVSTLEDLAATVGTNRNDARALLRLALLAPDIQKAILSGHQPQGLSFKSLTALDLPASWTAQRQRLGLADLAR